MRAARALIVAVAVVFVSCGGETSTGPEPIAPPPAPSVASIEVSPAAFDLRPGETVQLSATAKDQSGGTLTGVPITWSTTNPSVATVSGNGLVVAVSAGQVEIAARSGGVTGTAAGSVAAIFLTTESVVIDSTLVDLLSDDAERAAGIFRFRILSSSAPSMEVGSVILGAQGGGFLRRVDAVSVAADVVTLQTSEAGLEDVIKAGSLDIAVPINSGSVTGSLQSSLAAVAGGAASSATQAAVSFPLGNFDLCSLVTCPSGTQLKISTGKITLDATITGTAEFNEGLRRFQTKANGTLGLDLDVQLNATAKFMVSKEKEAFCCFRVPFTIVIPTAIPIPIPAVAEVAFIVGFQADLEAGATVQAAGYKSQHTVEVGFLFENDVFTPLNSTSSTFEVIPPSWNAQVDASLRVFARPELRLLVANVAGPTLGPELWAKAAGTVGTNACTFQITGSVDAKFGYLLKFLDTEVDRGTASLLGLPQLLFDQPCAGALTVTTQTAGTNIDPDGYVVTVDGTDSQAIGVNGSVTFPVLAPGDRSVELTGVAGTCSVSGNNPRTVTVPQNGTAQTTFLVDCSASPSVRVKTQTNGAPQPTAPYEIVVDGTLKKSVAVNDPGGVTFRLTAGTHSVELNPTTVPAQCVVGVPPTNPRDVNVPATGEVETTFVVTCGRMELAWSKVFRDQDGSDGFDDPRGEIWVSAADGSLKHKVGDRTVIGIAIGPLDWASDGRIAFAQNCSSGVGACIYVLSSSGTSKVSSGPFDLDPKWSPDGSQLVFRRIRRNVGTNDLMIISGSVTRNLTQGRVRVGPPRWSPDGTMIAFECFPDICAIKADGTGLLNITNDPAVDEKKPTWSPDGSKIAFQRDLPPPSGAQDIYVMNSDGTGTKVNLTNRPQTNDEGPLWSPDGSLILWSCSGGTCVMDPNGNNQTLISSGGQGSWSPDGNRLVLANSDGRLLGGFIEVIDRNGANRTLIDADVILGQFAVKVHPADWRP